MNLIALREELYSHRMVMNTNRRIIHSLENIKNLLQAALLDYHISKLPKIKISNAQIRAHKSCMVCLEDFQLNDEALLLSCLHFYHFVCITQWLKVSDSCPICRTRVAFHDDVNEEQIIGDNNATVANNGNQRVRARARQSRILAISITPHFRPQRTRRNIRAIPASGIITRSMTRRLAQQQQQQQQENPHI